MLRLFFFLNKTLVLDPRKKMNGHGSLLGVSPRVKTSDRYAASDRNLSWVEIVLAHIHFLPCAICAECFPPYNNHLYSTMTSLASRNVVFLLNVDNGSETITRNGARIEVNRYSRALDYVSNGVSRSMDLESRSPRDPLRRSAPRQGDSVS